MKVTEDNGLPLQAGQHELQLLLRELSAPPGARERLPADARLGRAIERSSRPGTEV
jgi:hypothetical protein